MNPFLEPGIVGYSCNPSYLGGGGKGITSSRLARSKLVRAYPKNKIKFLKGSGAGIAQVVAPVPNIN
jgi:hypothetical protein